MGIVVVVHQGAPPGSSWATGAGGRETRRVLTGVQARPGCASGGDDRLVAACVGAQQADAVEQGERRHRGRGQDAPQGYVGFTAASSRCSSGSTSASRLMRQRARTMALGHTRTKPVVRGASARLPQAIARTRPGALPLDPVKGGALKTLNYDGSRLSGFASRLTEKSQRSGFQGTTVPWRVQGRALAFAAASPLRHPHLTRSARGGARRARRGRSRRCSRVSRS